MEPCLIDEGLVRLDGDNPGGRHREPVAEQAVEAGRLATYLVQRGSVSVETPHPMIDHAIQTLLPREVFPGPGPDRDAR